MVRYSLKIQHLLVRVNIFWTPEFRASPRLKDATIPAESTTDLYVEIIVAMRKLYWVCKLVHADLSEYNILYVWTSFQCLPSLTRCP